MIKINHLYKNKNNYYFVLYVEKRYLKFDKSERYLIYSFSRGKMMCFDCELFESCVKEIC
jgi:hypothetical protein